jgi:hypothetical protein
MAVRKKDGGPDWKLYESTSVCEQFEQVKQYLLKNCKKVLHQSRVIIPDHTIRLLFCHTCYLLDLHMFHHNDLVDK